MEIVSINKNLSKHIVCPYNIEQFDAITWHCCDDKDRAKYLTVHYHNVP